jgi:hypothetical protein
MNARMQCLAQKSTELEAAGTCLTTSSSRIVTHVQVNNHGPMAAVGQIHTAKDGSR